MSYLPYYIKPVSSPCSTSATTTSSFTRPVYASAVTSPCTSVTSSARASPTRSLKDESFGTSPKASGYRRYERSNTSYVGYREDYIRKQNDKFCGKKSLEERLKNLEAGASVKLQVRKGSQGRRQRTSEKDFLSGLRSPQRGISSPSSSNKSSPSKTAERQVESTPCIASLSLPSPSTPPPPDIIEAHRPPCEAQTSSNDISKQSVKDTESCKQSKSRPRAHSTKDDEVTGIRENHVKKDLTTVDNKRTAVPTNTEKKPTISRSRKTSVGQKPKHTEQKPGSHKLHQAVKPDVAVVHSKKLQEKSPIIPEKKASEPTSKNKALEPTSKNKASEPTSKNKALEPTSKTKALEPTSKNKALEPASKNKALEPASKNKALEPTSKNKASEPSSKNRASESTSKNTARASPVPLASASESKALASPAVQRPINIESSLLNSSTSITDSRNKSNQEATTITTHQHHEPLKETTLASPDTIDPPPQPTIISNTIRTVSSATEDSPKSELVKPLPRREKSVVIDVATDKAVIPVELRSPRGSIPKEGFAGRVHMREKRSARVFVFPSSDESETESMLTKLNRYNGNRPPQVVPVKFVPAQTRSRSHTSSSSGKMDTTSSQASSNSSPSNNGKITTPQDKAILQAEQRRKSSRSPKRSLLKRSNRSKSNHDRSNTEKIKHTRTLSSGSQSPATLSTSSIDPCIDRSPDTPSRGGRSGRKNSSRTRYKTEYTELTNSNRSTPRSPRDFDVTSIPSPRQQAVADAVKFGFTESEVKIPFIDETGSPEGKKTPFPDPEIPSTGSEADQATIIRAFPLSRRGRSSRKKDEPRRTSYKEAVDGNTEHDNHDEDPRWFRHGMIFSDSDKEEVLASLGKMVRSNSADSVLSTSDAPNPVVMRQYSRASSADRTSLKGVYRRSYQIATNQAVDADLSNVPTQKPQASIKKLRRTFFSENSTSSGESPNDEFRRGQRSRSLGPPPTLIIDRLENSIVKEGFLYFKVATIEKGKRTTSQKSWKLVWVVLKEQSLYLCKDWSRNKQENTSFSFIAFGNPPDQLTLEEDEPLNIQASLITIAYNYQKRKNVFRLTTFNASEYLFQAEDKDEMLSWINAIQISGNVQNDEGEVIVNEDLILRKSNQFEYGLLTVD